MSINWGGAGCDAPPGAWTTAAGNELNITKMPSAHLFNCINFIHMRGGQLTKREELKLDELESEWSKRSESLDLKAKLKIRADALLKRRKDINDELEDIAKVVAPQKPWKCALREDLEIVI